MKKSSTIIFVYFLFFTGINCSAGDDGAIYSTTDNYGWISEAYRYTYQLKDSDGNYTTIIDNQSLYFLKEGRRVVWRRHSPGHSLQVELTQGGGLYLRRGSSRHGP